MDELIEESSEKPRMENVATREDIVDERYYIVGRKLCWSRSTVSMYNTFSDHLPIYSFDHFRNLIPLENVGAALLPVVILYALC